MYPFHSPRFSLPRLFVTLCLLGGLLLLTASCDGGVGQVCNTNEDCGPLTNCVSAACVPSTIMGESAPPLPWDGAPALDASPPEPHPPEGPAQDATKGCEEGTKRPCYTGPVGTAGVGLCKAGTQTCQNGQWQACTGAIPPLPEICDGLDNDCDGKVDTDQCACLNGQTRECYPSGDKNKGQCTPKDDGTFVCQGTCAAGKETCISGVWSACEGAKLPTEEVCDGLDNDCNGKIDELEERECYTGPEKNRGIGECKIGKQACQNGEWGKCVGDIHPQDKEPCKDAQQDADCDGTPGNGCDCTVGDKRACYAGPPQTRGKGVCKDGEQICGADGKWAECKGYVLPSNAETCNGKDDDCDGQIDNQPGTNAALTQPCYSGSPGTQGIGQCTAGTQTCSSGAWSACKGEVTPKTEQCNNLDDDCNGQTDDVAYPATTCKVPNTQGPCQQGVPRCVSGQKICSQTVFAQKEVCNGKDDDCDGQIDGIQQPCYTGDPKTKGISPCQEGVETCRLGIWGVCVGEKVPTTERCDKIDNDCNGQIDESCECTPGTTRPCYTGDPNTRKVGACKDGVERCSQAGTWGGCQNETKPKRETCNGQDDDCNGQVDDKLTNNVDLCTSAQGVCKGAPKICMSGSWVCTPDAFAAHAKEYEKTEVSCDKKDNDCDGLVDEVCGNKYPYALVQKGGALAANRDLTNFTLTGTLTSGYGLKSLRVGTTCEKSVVIASATSTSAASLGYGCSPTISNGFVLYPQSYNKSNKQMELTKGLPFHVMMPTDGTYGRVECSAGQKPSCTHIGIKGTAQGNRMPDPNKSGT